MKRIFLIMSLNNDASIYHFTRHNIGSWWIRYFCYLNNVSLVKDNRFSIYFSKVNFLNTELFLIEPFNYINFSGNILYNFLLCNSIQYCSILIIHDDLDLNVGDIRLKSFSTTSSHNGVNSVISFLKSSDFFRLRIGIGNNFAISKETYVLSEPSYKEKCDILFSIKCSLFCIDDILNLNFSSFRNNFLFLFNSGGLSV